MEESFEEEDIISAITDNSKYKKAKTAIDYRAETRRLHAQLWSYRQLRDFFTTQGEQVQLQMVTDTLENKQLYGGMSLSQLRTKCQQLGLDSSGTKQELVKALSKHRRSTLPISDTVPSLFDLTLKFIGNSIIRLSTWSHHLEFGLYPSTSFYLDKIPLDLRDKVLQYLCSQSLLDEKAAIMLHAIHFEDCKMNIPCESKYYPRIYGYVNVFIVGAKNEEINEEWIVTDFSDALEKAVSGDVILMCQGTYSINNAITENIELIGFSPDVYIVNEPQSRLFLEISSCHVRLENLTFVNDPIESTDAIMDMYMEEYDMDGHVIVKHAGCLLVENCIFQGVSIHLQKDTSANIMYTKFINNMSNAISVKTCCEKVVIEGCEFERNGNSVENSAAVLINSIPSKLSDFVKLNTKVDVSLNLQINDSVFLDNYAHSIGVLTDQRHYGRFENETNLKKLCQDIKGCVLVDGEELEVAADFCSENKMCLLTRSNYAWEFEEMIPAQDHILPLLKDLPNACLIHRRNFTYWTESPFAKFYKCQDSCIWGYLKQQIKAKNIAWFGEEQFKCSYCYHSCVDAEIQDANVENVIPDELKHGPVFALYICRAGHLQGRVGSY